jgi:hypothetical protein
MVPVLAAPFHHALVPGDDVGLSLGRRKDRADGTLPLPVNIDFDVDFGGSFWEWSAPG